VPLLEFPLEEEWEGEVELINVCEGVAIDS
jgi:hypothetical protein